MAGRRARAAGAGLRTRRLAGQVLACRGRPGGAGRAARAGAASVPRGLPFPPRCGPRRVRRRRLRGPRRRLVRVRGRVLRARRGQLGPAVVARAGQAGRQLLGRLPGGTDEHGLVELAAPLRRAAVPRPCRRRRCRRATRGRACRPARARAPPRRPRPARCAVSAMTTTARREAAPAPASRRGGDGRRPVPEPDHVAGVGPGHEQHDARPGRAGRTAGPSAPSLPQSAITSPPGSRGEQLAERTPESAEAGALLGVGHPGEHVKAAVQLLGVLPDLARLQAAARGHREAEQAAARVKLDRRRRRGTGTRGHRRTDRTRPAAPAAATRRQARARVVVTPGAPLSAAMTISAIR